MSSIRLLAAVCIALVVGALGALLVNLLQPPEPPVVRNIILEGADARDGTPSPDRDGTPRPPGKRDNKSSTPSNDPPKNDPSSGDDGGAEPVAPLPPCPAGEDDLDDEDLDCDDDDEDDDDEDDDGRED